MTVILKLSSLVGKHEEKYSSNLFQYGDLEEQQAGMAER